VGGQVLTVVENDPRQILTYCQPGDQVSVQLFTDCIHILPG